MHVEELKTFEMSWKEAAAQEMEHAPNGTFGLLLQRLDRNQHFIDVNLDSDFFQRLKVLVDCPTPFAPIGLSEVTLHLEYGDNGSGQPFYVDDVELKPDAQGHVTPQVLTCSLDKKRTLSYQYRLDFFFDPTSAIRGQKYHYTTAMISGIDRSVTIDPETYVGFLRVDAAAGDLDFDAIPRAQVKIGYDDASNNFHVEDTFVLAKDVPKFEWLVRLSDPQQRQYWYELTYFLVDDQTIVIPRQTSIERNLVINQPWEDRLNVLVDGQLAQGTARLVVEVEYQDSAAGYRFSHVKPITKPADVPDNVRIPVLDRTQRTYSYRITAVFNDNSVRQGTYTQASDPYLLASTPS
jgi:hypothetical protein